MEKRCISQVLHREQLPYFIGAVFLSRMWRTLLAWQRTSGTINPKQTNAKSKKHKFYKEWIILVGRASRELHLPSRSAGGSLRQFYRDPGVGNLMPWPPQTAPTANTKLNAQQIAHNVPLALFAWLNWSVC